MNTKTQSEFKTQADLDDVEIDGIDMADYPYFCDAYISSATCKKTGRQLTQQELDSLDSYLVYQLVWDRIF